MSRALAIALTGGIASGKSTVAGRFAEHGAPIIDADVLARELVAPGRPALDDIVAAFGRDALDANGALDRRAMRQRIFADPAARERLEAILHPRVRDALRARAETCAAPYCLLAIPLLAESLRKDAHAYDFIDRTLVIDVPRRMQIARLMQRDGTTETVARQILATQATRAQRLAIADEVLDNSGPPGALDAAVAKLHERYRALARQPG